MTITEFIASLNVGDTISYQIVAGITKKRTVTRIGEIIQILDKFITVKLDKYPDSIEINEIANGRIKVLDASGDPIEIEKEIIVRSDPPALPIETAKQSNLELEAPDPKQCAKNKDGTVNWKVMWPIVKPELAVGRDKYEVADEYGIPHSAMKSRLRKEKVPVLVAQEEEPSSELSALKGLTKGELISMQAGLRLWVAVIDVIVSCIDATLESEQKEAQAI